MVIETKPSALSTRLEAQMPDPEHPNRTKKLWGFALALMSVVGFLFLPPFQQARELVSWHWQEKTITGKPDCKDSGWYREAPVSNAVARNDEFRQRLAGELKVYSAGNTKDGERDTSWVTRMTSDPEQNSIKWQLQHSEHIVLVCIRTGFQQDPTRYANNRRPNTALLVGCGEPQPLDFANNVDAKTGQLVAGFELGDWNKVRVDCDSSEFELKIISSYPAFDGSHQVAISDVRFYRGFSFWRG